MYERFGFFYASVNGTNDKFFSTCVHKLESRMLITIMNSNSSPEVNSSEVSLKLFCVCMQKHPNHLLGGGALYLCARVFIYEFVPPPENLRSKL